MSRPTMRAPIAAPAQEELIGYPEYQDFDPNGTHVSDHVYGRRAGPLGSLAHLGLGKSGVAKEGLWTALLASWVKEYLTTLVLVLGVLVFVITPTTTDTVSKPLIIGLIYGFGVLLAYRIGNVPGLPRHANLALTTMEFLSGRVAAIPAIGNGLFALGGAVSAGAIVGYLPNAITNPTVPLIGTFGTQSTSTVGAIFVVLLGSALTTFVLANFTTYLQMGCHHHNIKMRPGIAAAVNAFVIAIMYMAYGIFTFDGWTYFGGAVAQVVATSNAQYAWSQSGTLYQLPPYVVPVIDGIAAMWILMPIVGGVLAFALDWVFAMWEYNGFMAATKLVQSAGKAGHVAAPVAESLGRSTSQPAAGTSVRGRNPNARATAGNGFGRI
jgi:hypothetical protein